MAKKGMALWVAKMRQGNKAQKLLDGLAIDHKEDYGKGVCRFFAKAGAITPSEVQKCISKVGTNVGRRWQENTLNGIDRMGGNDTFITKYKAGISKVATHIDAYSKHLDDSVAKSVAIREADPDRFLQQVAKGQIASFVYGLQTNRVRRRTSNTAERKKVKDIDRKAKIKAKAATRSAVAESESIEESTE